MKIGGRPEPVSVEIGWDEVWLEVICLTNSEIAGSPRNISRYSLKVLIAGVEHWIDFATQVVRSNQTPNTAMYTFGVSPIRLSGAVLRETTQTNS